MNSIVTPPLLPELTLPSADKPAGGQIVDVTLEAKLKPGQILLLETLVEIAASPDSPSLFKVNLNQNNQIFSFILKSDHPLDLPLNRPHQLEVKITGGRAPELRFQFIGIDGEKAENIFKARMGSVPLSPQKTIRPASIVETPALINNAGAPASKPQFIPLNSRQMAQALAKSVNVPESLINRLLPLVKDFTLPLEFSRLVETPLPETEFLAPLKQTLKDLIADPVKLPQAAAKLETQLQSLAGKTLTAQPLLAQASTQLLTTPLGTAAPETPFRLPPKTSVELIIQEPLASPSENQVASSLPLPPLLEKLALLLEKIPLPDKTATFHLQAALKEMPVARLTPLLEVLAPLAQIAEKDPAGSAILNLFAARLPSPNIKMLSNLHNFYRAALQKDPVVWLGKELSEVLAAHGKEGAQVIAKTTELLNVGTREGISWRQIEIPFFDGSTFIPFRLLLKKNREQDEKSSSNRPSGSRFVLETEFSRLGAFQFDGYAVASERRFDLLIRTTRPQEADFCTHIMNLFKTSLYNLGYVGKLNINQQETFVKIALDEPRQLKEGVFV